MPGLAFFLNQRRVNCKRKTAIQERRDEREGMRSEGSVEGFQAVHECVGHGDVFWFHEYAPEYGRGRGSDVE